MILGTSEADNKLSHEGAAQLRRVMAQLDQFKKIEPSIANDVMFSYIENELWMVVKKLENGNGNGGNGRK